MQDLNWNDLRVFLEVARTGQIGAAAKALRMDPTTLSRRLKRLEDNLERRLFERTREGQVLTEAGEALLEKAEPMGGIARQIEDDRAPELGLSGTVRLSVSEGFGSQFLARHMAGFAAEHPNLTLELVATSGFLSPSRREADIAVMLSRPKAGPVIARKLSDYRLRLYASADYLAQHGVPGSAADLAESHRLIGYVPDLLYAPELNYLSDFHSGLSGQLRSSSINAQREMVAAGAGIAVLPCFMADGDARLEVVLADRSIVRSFWMVTHRDTQNLLRIKMLRQWLSAVVQRHRELLLPG